jgi:hypothetical protein
VTSAQRARRLASVALLALAGAACSGAEPAPAPNPFQGGVRKVALLRRAPPDEERRPKDPLDAVAESLAAKGIEVRFVTVGGKGGEGRSVERLYDDVEGRVAASAGFDARGRSSGSLGDADGKVVRALGVDAVVTYHRWRGLSAADPLSAPMGGAYARPQVRTRAVGALGIVGPAGELLAFDWGPRDTTVAPNAAETAAEAVDATVRALTGEPDGA